MRPLAALFLIPVALALPGFAQLSGSATWAAQVETRYRLDPNVEYATAGGVQMPLDVYYRRDSDRFG